MHCVREKLEKVKLIIGMVTVRTDNLWGFLQITKELHCPPQSVVTVMINEKETQVGVKS